MRTAQVNASSDVATMDHHRQNRSLRASGLRDVRSMVIVCFPE